QVSRNLMPSIETREPPFGIQILIVLRHHAPAASDRRGIVDRLRKRVADAASDASGLLLAQSHGGRVQDRIAFRGLPQKWLHAVDPQPVRIAIRGADDVEMRALCTCIPTTQLPSATEVAI